MVLDDVIDKLWDIAISRSTRAVYEAGFRAFHRFSNIYPSGSLSSTHPAISEDILIYFVAHCVNALQLKYSTIKTYLAGTRFAYIKAGFQDPCCFPNGQSFLRLRAILKAVKKSQDNTVKPRLPITSSILSQCCQILRSGFLGAYEDLVLETAFCMAFFGFLRCGEFTCKSHIFDPLTDLSIQDIQLSTNNSQFTLQLKVSKTDPFRRGVSINYFSTGRLICPLQCMLALLHTRSTMGAQPRDPLFTTIGGSPLTRAFFIDKLMNLLSRLGYNPSFYSGHSFRVGAATSAAEANIPDHMIRTLGRWNSDCYTRYIRTSQQSLRQAQQAMCQQSRR